VTPGPGLVRLEQEPPAIAGGHQRRLSRGGTCGACASAEENCEEQRSGHGTLAAMKLGEILIQEGHLTQEGLEEALDWQVLYGGRLGTNLLELKLVEEEHLAKGLGRQLGVEVAWGP